MNAAVVAVLRCPAPLRNIRRPCACGRRASRQCDRRWPASDRQGAGQGHSLRQHRAAALCPGSRRRRQTRRRHPRLLRRRATHRSARFSERSLASGWMCIPLPDGLDDVTAAAIANPAMSSWVALTARAKFVAGRERSHPRRHRCRRAAWRFRSRSISGRGASSPPAAARSRS